MNDKIELSGGPYIVKRNKGGGIDLRYGWSELIIENGNCIKVVCTDDEDFTRTILNFRIKNAIPREYKILEKIQIYLKIGYNTCYAYSYSDINNFKTSCINYFIQLNDELSIEKNCN